MSGRLKIVLKGDASVKFPEWCIKCGQICNSEIFEITGHRDKFFDLWKNIINGRPKHSVYMHQNCGKQLNHTSLKKKGLLYTVCTALIVAYFLLNKGISRFVVASAIFLTAFIDKLFIDKYLKDSPIDFYQGTEKITFYFQNPKYEEEFYELNRKNLYKQKLLKNFPRSQKKK